VWAVLNRQDEPDLGQHARQLLHHVPERGSVSLTWLAQHLNLPKSSASVTVKELARRGFVERSRDPADERRLAIVLTEQGRARLAADTVLDTEALSAALDRLAPQSRDALLAGLEQLAAAAESIATGAGERHG
jgi:DNA-binding MarR family transcriptional regulator